MNAGLLDVFHDSADEHVATIADRIDVDFDRIIQESIEQHRTLVRDLHRIGHVGAQIVFVEDDFHGASTKHVGWAHDQGEAHLTRERQRLRLCARRGVGGLAKPERLH